jgi:hypothetical protein
MCWLQESLNLMGGTCTRFWEIFGCRASTVDRIGFWESASHKSGLFSIPTVLSGFFSQVPLGSFFYYSTPTNSANLSPLSWTFLQSSALFTPIAPQYLSEYSPCFSTSCKNPRPSTP